MALSTITRGPVIQVQRWLVPGTEQDRQPPSTGYTYRDRAKRELLEKPTAIIRNPKDSSGWRNPSPYALTAYNVSEFFGTLKTCPEANPNNVFEYRDSYVRKAFLAGTSTQLPSVTANMVNRAEVECLNKLKDLNVNYAVALAESRKSMGMIAENLLRIAEAYAYGKRGRWEQAAKKLGVTRPSFKATSKDVSSRWLELTYGWLPLLSDAYGAYEDARKGLLWRQPRISVTRTVSVPLQGYDEEHDNGLRAVYTHSEGSKYGVKVRLDYQLKSDALSAASNIGLTNPATVAWELTPFSFVLDWALPIGNWLDAFDADFGLTFLGGTRTKFVRINRTGTIRHASKREAYKPYYADLESHFTYFSMDRVVYRSPPLPTPYWKNPISTSHVLNALALLRALF